MSCSCIKVHQSAGEWTQGYLSVALLIWLQARAEVALRRIGINSVEAATEWLLMHPEEPAAAAAPAAGAEREHDACTLQALVPDVRDKRKPKLPFLTLTGF